MENLKDSDNISEISSDDSDQISEISEISETNENTKKFNIKICFGNKDLNLDDADYLSDSSSTNTNNTYDTFDTTDSKILKKQQIKMKLLTDTNTKLPCTPNEKNEFNTAFSKILKEIAEPKKIKIIFKDYRTRSESADLSDLSDDYLHGYKFF